MGPHQTAKLQSADIRYGRICKSSLTPVLARQRRRKRQAAYAAESAPLLLATVADLCEVMECVVDTMVRDNDEHSSILKIARAAGLFALSKGPDGMEIATGGAWADYPLTNSRVVQACWDQRFSNLSEIPGCPGQYKAKPAQFGKVHELRAKQSLARKARDRSYKIRAKVEGMKVKQARDRTIALARTVNNEACILLDEKNTSAMEEFDKLSAHICKALLTETLQWKLPEDETEADGWWQ